MFWYAGRMYQHAAVVGIGDIQTRAIVSDRGGVLKGVRTVRIIAGVVAELIGLADDDIGRGAVDVGKVLKIRTRSLPPSAINSRVPSENAKRGKGKRGAAAGGVQRRAGYCVGAV